ncbi:MAG: hypothetical protein HY904_09280 [Deltaproteobacteria bacterium]|nr:hypothetical protein [Deltaproteobacteria bacterium]
MSFSDSTGRPPWVPPAPSTPSGPSAQGARADEIKSLIRAGRMYDALGVNALASGDEIRAILEARWAAWSQARAVARGNGVLVLDEALEALRFLGVALLNPSARRTVHLAFAQGTVPTATEFASPDADALRMGWVRLFPDAAAAANAHARAAMRAHDGKQPEEAARHAREALALDPFNASLRGMAETWLRS